MALGEHIATRGLGHADVPDILRELASFGIAAVVHDPLADPAGAAGEYGIELGRLDLWHGLDALVLAVPHRAYRELGEAGLCALLAPGGILIDVRSALDPAAIPPTLAYWSL